MFPNRSGAFLILEDRLRETSSETGEMEGVIFGVDDLADGFSVVCAGSKGVLVLETSETGVFSFGNDLVGLLMFSLSSDV